LGGVDVDVAALMSTTHHGSSEITPCVLPLPGRADVCSETSILRTGTYTSIGDSNLKWIFALINGDTKPLGQQWADEVVRRACVG